MEADITPLLLPPWWLSTDPFYSRSHYPLSTENLSGKPHAFPVLSAFRFSYLDCLHFLELPSPPKCHDRWPLGAHLHLMAGILARHCADAGKLCPCLSPNVSPESLSPPLQLSPPLVTPTGKERERGLRELTFYPHHPWSPTLIPNVITRSRAGEPPNRSPSFLLSPLFTYSPLHCGERLNLPWPPRHTLTQCDSLHSFVTSPSGHWGLTPCLDPPLAGSHSQWQRERQTTLRLCIVHWKQIPYTFFGTTGCGRGVPGWLSW